MEWKVRSDQTLVSTRWFELKLAEVELPDGRSLDHYLLRLPPVVLTAMLDAQDRVLLIRRYRFIPATWGWELPSGIADPAEDYPAAAAREALKETGWEPRQPSLLVRLEASAGLTDSVHHVYWTRQATQRGEPGYETERLDWIPLPAAVAMIASGQVRAASTAAALLLLRADPPARAGSG
jgi:8-oxo-dGTP pyrophosphatase MutT (NUDIX family)